MRKYDLITIFKPGGNLEDQKKALNELLTRFKVVTEKETDWGDRRLPHEVDDLTNGHFLFTAVKMQPEVVKDLKREMQIERDILRYMIRRAA